VSISKGLWRPVPGISTSGNSNGNDIATPVFEHDSRQRARRRPLQYRSVRDQEGPAVTRTIQPVRHGIIENRTRSVRANPAVGCVGVLRRPQENARLDIGRICKDLRPADRNFFGLRHDARCEVAGKSRPQEHKQSACDSNQSYDREHLSEPAARYFRHVLSSD
jgi:hypothetical protein